MELCKETQQQKLVITGDEDEENEYSSFGVDDHKDLNAEEVIEKVEADNFKYP